VGSFRIDGDDGAGGQRAGTSRRERRAGGRRGHHDPGRDSGWVGRKPLVAVFLVTSVATNVLLLIVGGVGVATGTLPGQVSWEASLLPALGAAVMIVAVAYLPRVLPVSLPPAQSRWRALAARLNRGRAAWRVRPLRRAAYACHRGNPVVPSGADGRAARPRSHRSGGRASALARSTYPGSGRPTVRVTPTARSLIVPAAGAAHHSRIG
jgi:hypothetical protein